jgi:hypothetical protein
MRRSSIVVLGLGLSLAGCGGETAGGETTATHTATAPLCALPASCAAAEPACVGLTDNAGLHRFGLRMAQIDVTEPVALLEGVPRRVFTTDVLPADLACNLDGAGTLSWILRFDRDAGTLEVGGAGLTADPTRGYAFVDGTVLGWEVAPATFPLAIDAGGSFHTTAPRDLALPMYLDAAGHVTVLPLRSARFTGALSPSQGCIGRYEPAGLDAANGCLPDETHPAFVTGATAEGLLSLEEADRVFIPETAVSFCALVAGEARSVTDAAGVTRCRRDAGGRVVFAGDACTTAGAACGDAVRMKADFAASAVRVAE